MNREQLEAIGETVESRVRDLIDQEGDLGGAALAVVNALRATEMLAHNSAMPEAIADVLKGVIVDAIALAVQTSPDARFLEVYARARAILTDAETAAKSTDGLARRTGKIIEEISRRKDCPK